MNKGENEWKEAMERRKPDHEPVGPCLPMDRATGSHEKVLNSKGCESTVEEQKKLKQGGR